MVLLFHIIWKMKAFQWELIYSKQKLCLLESSSQTGLLMKNGGIVEPFHKNHLLWVCSGVTRKVWRHGITNRPRHCWYPGSEVQMEISVTWSNMLGKGSRKRVLAWASFSFHTLIAWPIVRVIQSKTLVLAPSTSNDLQCKRHLSMIQAAISLFPANSRSCAIHLMDYSWLFYCSRFMTFAAYPLFQRIPSRSLMCYAVPD